MQHSSKQIFNMYVYSYIVELDLVSNCQVLIIWLLTTKSKFLEVIHWTLNQILYV